MPDEFGGVEVEEPQTDEFGGVEIPDEPQPSFAPKGPPTRADLAMRQVGADKSEAFSPFVPLGPDVKATTLPGQLVAAPYNFTKRLIEGTESRGGVGTALLGMSGVPIVNAGIGARFGVPAIKEGLRRVYTGTALGEPQEAIEGALQALSGGVLTGGAVKEGVEGFKPKGGKGGALFPTGQTEPISTPETPVPKLSTEISADLGDDVKQALADLPKEKTAIEMGIKSGALTKEGVPIPAFQGLKPGEAALLMEAITDPEAKIPESAKARLLARVRRNNQEGVLGPEQAPPAATTGEAQPSAAPGGATVETPVSAGETPQAKEEVSTPEAPKQETTVTEPVTEQPKGIAASVRNKWTSATDPLGSEAGFVSLEPLRDLVEKATPYVRGAVNFVRDLASEESKLTKLGDYGKAINKWSGKLQTSFMEASQAQQEIESKVPDPVRQQGITNWLQAGGNPDILKSRLDATVDPKLRKGYQAALDLTPDEIAVAKDVKAAQDRLGNRGKDADILQNFKENYVTQIWDLGKGPIVGGARNLRNKFRFAKASTFPTYFDGEQAGYTPKNKAIGKILPVYLHEMNFVIANRQLAEELTHGTASDGRPLAVRAGTELGDSSEYKSIPGQPAIAGWKFHPEAYSRLKNVLGKSAIREWYSNRTTALAQIPKMLVKGLDMANSETKRTMLGLLAPFHQVQEGTHGVGHRVSPFWSIPKVDLVSDAAQRDAAQHGLMLAPDRASAEQFMEGFRTSGLVSKIPKIGALADHYSNYLFHDYIPGLKYKTYQAILERNQKVYAKDLASGSVDLADVKHLSAEQANAAYGHLNYTDLARNPTIQHIMQMGLLAPDFLESRMRFAGQSIKGLTGAKVGREQILALSTLALAQAATAYTAAKLAGGDWDASRPFEVRVGYRRYSLRSVPEDIVSFMKDRRAFLYSRLSPIIGKGIAQYLFKTDYRGHPISAGETTKELVEQPIPISVKGFAGLGRQSLSGLEQLASAVGLRISRYSPSTDVFDMAHKWMAESGDAKAQKRLEIQQQSVFPDSEYKTLRETLLDNNQNAARSAYQELLKTKTPEQVRKALAHPHPFTGSKHDEKKFVDSLNEKQLKIYNQAVRERREILDKFIQLRNQ